MLTERWAPLPLSSSCDNRHRRSHSCKGHHGCLHVIRDEPTGQHWCDLTKILALNTERICVSCAGKQAADGLNPAEMTGEPLVRPDL